jgi:hypothetical protein
VQNAVASYAVDLKFQISKSAISMDFVPVGEFLSRRGRLIAENKLYALSAIRPGFEQNADRFAQLRDARVGAKQGGAARGALDPIQIRRQRKAAPSHFKVILFKRLFCVRHTLSLYPVFRKMFDPSRRRGVI